MTATERRDPPASLERARLLRAQGQIDAAIAELRAVVASEPRAAEALHQLGNALKSQGRYDEAEGPLREAARLAPDNAAVHLNLGVACLESGRVGEAIQSFERAVRLEPGRPDAHNILGHARFLRGQCTEALAAFADALRVKPDFAPAHDNIGRVLKAQGRAAEALAHHQAALAARLEPGTHSNVLYTLNLLADQAPAEVAAEHRRWAQCHAAFPGAGGRLLAASGPSDRRLRVGYVSPDFVLHAVSFFILPILAAHDRNRWEVFCYSNARVADAVTGRIRGLAEHWRDIARLSDDAAAELIRRDGLDVLIDLAGHTAHNRLLVFARRPAPVQATWLGYPNTTGLPQIDYRLTDAVSDPPGTTEAWHSEKLWRLPGPFLCYEPPAVAPAVNALPADPADGVTFACFNNLAKINPELVGLWARLLRDVPGSRLLLKSPGLADPPTVAAVRARFAAAGVAGDRIGCDGTRLSVADHLGLYRGVDVALDAHPYNGTTTTCEALLMGVPVVTLAGQVHAARVGASLLTHLGRSEWIAATADAYVEIARGLAGDRSRLGAIRAELRAQLLRSPLCDAVGFTRRLESAYSGMLAQPSAERAGGFGRVAGPTACGKSVA